MKLKRLMQKIKSYLDAGAGELQKEDEGLTKVLKKLKKKELNLKTLIAAEKDKDDREMLEQELKIVHSQRKKGVKLLAQVRKKKKS